MLLVQLFVSYFMIQNIHSPSTKTLCKNYIFWKELELEIPVVWNKCTLVYSPLGLELYFQNDITVKEQRKLRVYATCLNDSF